MKRSFGILNDLKDSHRNKLFIEQGRAIGKTRRSIPSGMSLLNGKLTLFKWRFKILTVKQVL